MSGAKHTPGPWALDRSKNVYGNQLDDAPILGTLMAGEWHVAVITSDLRESEANARLIAAAPELLRALEMAWSEDFTFEAAESAAIAALAKARGEIA